MAEVVATSAQLFKSANGNWRFRIKAGNGETIATGEEYVDKRDAVAAATALLPMDAPVIEVEEQG